jgi:hypothetical protein
MIPGLRGSLLSHDALAGKPFADVIPESIVDGVRRAIRDWHVVLKREAGPSWTARAVLDRVAEPFCRAFGLELVVTGGDARVCHGLVRRNGSGAAAVVALGWGRDPGSGWREGVRTALRSGVRWCLCFTGPTLKIVDAERTHSRRFAEIELDALGRRVETLTLVCHLLGTPHGAGSGLDAAVRATEAYRVHVRNALQTGVQEALVELVAAFARAHPLPRGGRRREDLLDESLVVIYRVLFLLFAEARRLVPSWHPVYRDGYTIASLRARLEARAPGHGLWEALQAIARLAHTGCRAGTLRVPPFNGRLFSPDHAPLADSVPLDDEAVRKALLALTTRRTTGGRLPIAYADLGVEQLGGVYERVLDFEVGKGPGRATLVSSARRKATGSFYTPRSLTEYLVRRTLAPLVAGASPAQILELRVLDPSMGSGAFLVAACRYLAAAYERALIRDGDVTASDLGDADRAAFRRIVAQRTLFGVDVNPMAVQLARLSLWLTTLCADRPLSFFDHHLRTGNSLVGAGLGEVTLGRSGGRRRPAPTPLLPDDSVDTELGRMVAGRLRLTQGREETLQQVRGKEDLFARLSADTAPLGRWKAIADLWCAGWFEEKTRAHVRATYGALIDTVLGRPGGLSRPMASGILDAGGSTARRERFFHWGLEFPEIFHAEDGSALPRPGFDAILGNPPWEMLRGDAGAAGDRAAASEAGTRLTRFARDSGIYRLQGAGHSNLYQLFLERSLSLVRQDGRLGLVLPSGFAVDHGSAGLRRFLLDQTSIDSFTSVENREGLFPIHRGLRFVLVTLTRGAASPAVPLRSGIVSAPEFDRLAESGPDPLAVTLSRPLIERFSGDQAVIPDVRTPADLEIVTRILARAPAARAPDGWGLRFGRELNATDDKVHFRGVPAGIPVIEGKHVQPFAVNVAGSRQFITRQTARRIAGGRAFQHARVAYRDVASAGNRLTLIAAVLPPGTITTHTLFCLKTPLEEEAQHFIAGVFNSFVANYLVRMRVTTHVTVAIVEQLPLPRPERGSPEFESITGLSRRLARTPSDRVAMARLQTAVAHLYGLEREQFEHVVSTFPLVPEELRRASIEAYGRTL